MLPRVDCSVANVGYRNHRQRRDCVIVHQVLTVQTEPAGPGLIRIREDRHKVGPVGVYIAMGFSD